MLKLFVSLVLVGLALLSLGEPLSGTNWAVIVCSSRYWFNYRHFANALAIYRTLKARGYDDEHIIFMSSMEPACDTRNPYVGEIFTTRSELQKDLYNNDTQIDYKGSECNVESFMRLLTGRVSPGTPTSKQLLSDEESKILIYLTGHGGDEFLKFHDTQEVSSQDMDYVFKEMRLKRRFKEILLIVDTCQASTFANSIETSNVYTLTSSLKGENSYAYETNTDLGVAVLDRFTHALVAFLDRHRHKQEGRKVRSIRDLVNSFDRRFLYSTATLQVSTGSERSPGSIPIADFFESSSPPRDFEVFKSPHHHPSERTDTEADIPFITYNEMHVK